MNKERRANISRLRNQLEGLKSDIVEVCSEEQEYYDNMPESFQNGEKGEAAQSAINELEAAVSLLDDAISSLESAEE